MRFRLLYGDMSIEEIDMFNLSGIRHKEDCRKIQEVFREKGVNLTLLECQELYETYSYENFCGSWENGIDHFSIDFIFEILLPVLVELIDDKANRIMSISLELEKENYINL